MSTMSAHRPGQARCQPQESNSQLAVRCSSAYGAKVCNQLQSQGLMSDQGQVFAQPGLHGHCCKLILPRACQVG